MPNPFGYGRVVRNHEGDVEAIVEEKDATPEQREIDEINSGILAFDAEFLVSALPRISNDNAKGEYYLTDAVGLAREDGLTVGAHLIDDVAQTRPRAPTTAPSWPTSAASSTAASSPAG